MQTFLQDLQQPCSVTSDLLCFQEEEMSLGEVRDYETPGQPANTALQENIHEQIDRAAGRSVITKRPWAWFTLMRIPVSVFWVMLPPGGGELTELHLQLRLLSWQQPELSPPRETQKLPRALCEHHSLQLQPTQKRLKARRRSEEASRLSVRLFPWKPEPSAGWGAALFLLPEASGCNSCRRNFTARLEEAKPERISLF